MPPPANPASPPLWLSRTKKFTPGKYTLTITAITPGVGATSQQLRFTIVR